MKFRSLPRLMSGLALLALAGSVAAQTPAASSAASGRQDRAANAAAPRPQPQAPLSPFLPGFWWRDYRRTLGLTEEQSQRIDTVVQTHFGIFREKAAELRRQEEDLSRLIMTDASEDTIARQADSVEALRALLNKNRTLMLVRVRAVLTPEQRANLTTLREQWERDQRSGNDRGRQGDDRNRRQPNQRQEPSRAQ
jgi:Spy/CpxP family protein refolding chaperone